MGWSRSMRWVALAAAVALAGCGAPAGSAASRAADGASSRTSVAIAEPLLVGVRPEGRCRLVEAVGAPDDPSTADAALGAGVGTTLVLGVDRGPLVAADERGTDRTVVAATLFGADGQGYDVAAWVVDRGATPPTVTAANRAAAAGSAHRLVVVDTAGSNERAYALAFATDCSAAAAAPFRPPAPPEPEPSVRPDLILADPAVAAPGAVVALRFPRGTGRGVAFQLDRALDGAWAPVAWMTSDANGGDPVTVPAFTEGYGTADVGIGGPGPDRVQLPDDAVPGTYRICTANAGDEFCALLEITAE